MSTLYLRMKKCSFCITSTPTANATNNTTRIHHVYKPFFCPDWKLGLVCHQIGSRVRSSFLSGHLSLLQKQQQHCYNVECLALIVIIYLYSLTNTDCVSKWTMQMLKRLWVPLYDWLILIISANAIELYKVIKPPLFQNVIL